MTEKPKSIRLSKAVREFNVGMSTIVDFLKKKGYEIESNPNTKLSGEIYDLLMDEYQTEKNVKEEAKKIGLDYSDHHTISIEDRIPVDEEEEEPQVKDQEDLFIKSISFDLKKDKQTEPPVEKPEKKAEKPEEKIEEKEDDKKTEEPKEKKEEVKEKPEPAKKTKAKKTVKQKITAEEKKVKEEKVEKKAGEEEKEEKPVKKDEKDLKVVGKVDPEKISKTKSAEEARKEKAEKEVTEDKKEKVKPEKEKVTEKPAAEEADEKPVDKKPDEKKDEKPKEEPAEKKEEDKNFLHTRVEKLSGPTILGTIELPEEKKQEKKKKPVASSSDDDIQAKKKKRRRIKHKKEAGQAEPSADRKTEKDKKRFKDRRAKQAKPELSEDEIQKQIKETLQRLSTSGKSKSSKHRRLKRETLSKAREEEKLKEEEQKKVIKVTEFVTANELATMMNVPVTEVISTCMSLGLFVSINQRLDAETLTLLAEEFGYKVDFVSVDVQEAIHQRDEDLGEPEDQITRTPIATVMGHVDHGKTSLLDYIRKTNVIAGESGGITQHIGAYEVELENGKKITFLDTPGHEAFTAMRARGASVTDIAVIVVAADDNIMPQTIEAINHAQAAGVPIVIAINKIDKPNANPDLIKEQLSKINILVEDWGGKYQAQEISAKKGDNVDLLLEKVLLEAEMLELKGNPKLSARGTVIESSLDKGRGYVAKLLVQNGTLRMSDVVLAGASYGRVKAMYNERNNRISEAGPSSPVLMLGFNSAPQAGDQFNVLTDEREAKAIANKRMQLQREQGLRTQKHITLDEIGRRIAIGDFKELNIIVKADVDGSVEALSDSLLKLSTEQVQVNVIHKSVGQVTETDVMLASASNAIIIAFQVRPSVGARKLAEKEQIDIRLYSIIYTAINEINDAIEGMLSPKIEEKITCNAEVREIFKISKVGTIAGCMVLDGKITRNTKVRIIRDGIVIYTGELGSLKRFKEDVKEVKSGFECGLNIENFNDIKVGDIIEGYEQVEVKQKL